MYYFKRPVALAMLSVLSVNSVLGQLTECEVEDGTYVTSLGTPELTGCYEYSGLDTNGFPLFVHTDGNGAILPTTADDGFSGVVTPIWALVADGLICLTDGYPYGNPGSGGGVDITSCVVGTTTDAEFSCGCGSTSPTAEPVSAPTPEPVPAPTPEPVPAPTPEPVPAPTPEPVPAPTPEPVPAPTPEPVPAPTPEPVEAPTPEPVAAPTPEPASVPLPVSTPEPTLLAPSPGSDSDSSVTSGGTDSGDSKPSSSQCEAEDGTYVTSVGTPELTGCYEFTGYNALGFSSFAHTGGNGAILPTRDDDTYAGVIPALWTLETDDILCLTDGYPSGNPGSGGGVDITNCMSSPTTDAEFSCGCGSISPTSEPVSAPTPEPVAAPTSEPVAAPTPGPVSAPTPEPVPAPTPEPVSAPTLAPVLEPTPEPVPAPTPEPISAPTPRSVPAPTPEPASVTLPVSTPEPSLAPSPGSGSDGSVTPGGTDSGDAQTVSSGSSSGYSGGGLIVGLVVIGSSLFVVLA